MSSRSTQPTRVPILLNGGTVTREFRDATFDAANRRGISAICRACHRHRGSHRPDRNRRAGFWTPC